MKKIIALIIVSCCFFSACSSVDTNDNEGNVVEQASERMYVEKMELDDFTQVTNDTIAFSMDIGNIFEKMAELSCKYADTINSSKTFDWSVYADFRENKAEALKICDVILTYDDSNCSKEYQLCLDEFKSMAYQIKYFFNTVSKNMDIHEVDVLTQNMQNAIHVGMDYATVYQIMGTISYLESNDGDAATIENLKQQIANNYIYKVVMGYSEGNSGKVNTAFTNSYGSVTTKCAHSGCENAIATSGDTNCCITHSNKCYNCGKYIDEDAIFCMDCISGKTTTPEDTGKYDKSNVPESGCQYSYFDGSICGKSTNKYANLCDFHFKELNDTYQSFIGK